MNSMEIAAAAFAKVLEASFAASVLVLIVLVIQFALRTRLTPAWRFALWLPVVLRLLLPYVPESPASVFNLPLWIRSQTAAPKTELIGVDAASVALPAATTINSTPSAQRTVTPNAVVPAPKSTLPAVQILALIWLVGAAFLLARLTIGGLWFQLRLSRHRLPRKPELVELLARLRSELNLRSNPDIIETPLVSSPCLFGFFRPRLLLPSDLHSNLTPAELSHVILHELAHLKRRDLFTNFLMAVAHAIHWFNPIVWLAFRRMRLERELACDQLVLESRGSSDPKGYGQTLLKLLHDFRTIPSPSALVGIAEDKQAAALRLSYIAQFAPRSSRFSKLGFALIALVTLCGLTSAQVTQTGV